jgi:sec-independent protein translocase protein TatA
VFDFSPIQIIIVLGIALLVFGPKRLPDLGRSLGNGIRDFRGALTGDGHDHDSTTHLTGPVAETTEPTTEQIIADAVEPTTADEPALVAAAGRPTSTSS